MKKFCCDKQEEDPKKKLANCFYCGKNRNTARTALGKRKNKI